MAKGQYVFRDTLISVVPAVCVTSPTLHCRWRRSHPRQSYYIHDSSGSSPYVLADNRVFRYSVLSLILVGVCVTSRILRSTGQRAHLPQRYIPHSSSCLCGLQEITSLRATVVCSYCKCVALSVMRTIRWDVNGIHVSTIPNLFRWEGSD
jgi:Zn finger protein HypA/HybF involved in hydrogenase expression